eukprot:7102749-Lingulodinium_polyedra.AAC.1
MAKHWCLPLFLIQNIPMKTPVLLGLVFFMSSTAFTNHSIKCDRMAIVPTSAILWTPRHGLLGLWCSALWQQMGLFGARWGWELAACFAWLSLFIALWQACE